MRPSLAHAGFMPPAIGRSSLATPVGLSADGTPPPSRPARWPSCSTATPRVTSPRTPVDVRLTWHQLVSARSETLGEDLCCSVARVVLLQPVGATERFRRSRGSVGTQTQAAELAHTAPVAPLTRVGHRDNLGVL